MPSIALACRRVGWLLLGTTLAGGPGLAPASAGDRAGGDAGEWPASPWQSGRRAQIDEVPPPTHSSRAPAATGVPPQSAAHEPLVVVARYETLERDEPYLTWRIDYRLRSVGPEPFVIPADAIAARVSGLVSNSRVAAHATPRESVLLATSATGLVAVEDVIPAGVGQGQREGQGRAHNCRERLIVQVWPEAEGPEPTAPMSDAGRRPLDPRELSDIPVAPGQILRVRLRLEHQHPLHGPFEPLLGRRPLELSLGPASLADVMPLDRPRPVPALLASATNWPPPVPAEFQDRQVYLSAPDSLHLEAHVPGKQSYRFPDLRGIKYGSRMVLSFWYLVAPGTEGPCQARLAQYRDLPNSWKTLPDGELTISLDTVGRWTRVERAFFVQDEATALTLDLRLLGAQVNVGELWIDNVQIAPADLATAGLAGP